MTLPFLSNNGPPLLPGWIGAEIWYNATSPWNPVLELIIPVVSLISSPIVDVRGYPNTNTSSPTSDVVFEIAYGIGPKPVKFESEIFKRAKSLFLSHPTIVTA